MLACQGLLTDLVKLRLTNSPWSKHTRYTDTLNFNLNIQHSSGKYHNLYSPRLKLDDIRRFINFADRWTIERYEVGRGTSRN